MGKLGLDQAVGPLVCTSNPCSASNSHVQPCHLSDGRNISNCSACLLRGARRTHRVVCGRCNMVPSLALLGPSRAPQPLCPHFPGSR